MNSDAYEVVGQLFASGNENDAKFVCKYIEVNASSLGRVFQHITQNKVGSWGIVTSYRDSKTLQENKSDFLQLKNKVRSLKLGFFVLEGHGQEEDSEGKVRTVIEPSLFIPGISLKDIQRLSDEYKQFGFVYSGPETNNEITLVSLEGKQKLGSFQPMKIAQFYSKIKGRFVFAAVEAELWDKPARSNIERLWRKRQGVNNDPSQSV